MIGHPPATYDHCDQCGTGIGFRPVINPAPCPESERKFCGTVCADAYYPPGYWTPIGDVSAFQKAWDATVEHLRRQN